jgi:hypothetical protein
MREVVTSTDILPANANHPYFLIMDWSNEIALLRIPTQFIFTKRLESKRSRLAIFFDNPKTHFVPLRKEFPWNFSK